MSEQARPPKDPRRRPPSGVSPLAASAISRAQSQALQGSPSPVASQASRATHARDRYTPSDPSSAFDESMDVAVGDGVFRVYRMNATKDRTQADITSQSDLDRPQLVCVCLHGCGHSALAFAEFARHLVQAHACSCLSFDIRGHGSTKTSDDDAPDLSVDRQCRDLVAVLTGLYGPAETMPPILLIGHSMGGAIAVHAAHSGGIPSLVGLAVIDVVEGTALEALSSMMSIIRARPSHFESLQAGIKWCVQTGQVRNLSSARMSFPAQLRPVDQQERDRLVSQSTDASIAIPEEESEEGGEAEQHLTSVSHNNVASQAYTWRVDLERTEPFWREWFTGISSKFLQVPVPKLLLLAGTDRLDRTLTIGQMQGKFQFSMIRNTGHCVHEDAPSDTADIVAAFIKRQRLGMPLF